MAERLSEVPRLPVGDYYAGLDLGKKQDPSALALIRKEGEVLRLVGLKVFPLETEYVAILGFLRLVAERIQYVHRFLSTKQASASLSSMRLSKTFGTSMASF